MKRLHVVTALLIILNILLGGCVPNQLSEPLDMQTVNDTLVLQGENEDLEEMGYDLEHPLFLGVKRNGFLKNEYYYFNADGELLEESEERKTGFFAANGLAVASDVNGKIGYMDRNGVFVIEPEYDYALGFGVHNVAPVGHYIDIGTKKWGVIDDKGREVVPCIYDEISQFYDNGYAVTQREDSETGKMLYGIIDTEGKMCVAERYCYGLFIHKDYVVVGSADDVRNGTCTEILDYEGNCIKKIGRASGYYEFIYADYDHICFCEQDMDDGHTIEKYYEFVDGEFVEESCWYYDGETPARRVPTRVEATRYTATYHMSAATESGYAWEIAVDGAKECPVIYDSFEQKGDYLFLYKERGEDGSKSTDIYDLEKKEFIAKEIQYRVWLYDPFQLPEEYYVIEDWTGGYGIIKENGDIVLKPQYSQIIVNDI